VNIDMNDKSEYKDMFSFYIYKLKQINENDFEIEYIKPVDIPIWLAEKTFIKNWSYEKIVFETQKAFRFEGKNYKGEDKWIAKIQLEVGSTYTESDEFYRTHKNSIKEKESDLFII
jgi:hypothetical protein